MPSIIQEQIALERRQLRAQGYVTAKELSKIIYRTVDDIYKTQQRNEDFPVKHHMYKPEEVKEWYKNRSNRQTPNYLRSQQAKERAQLKEQGYITAKELAKELFVQPSTVSQWKRRFSNFPHTNGLYKVEEVRAWLKTRETFTKDSRIARDNGQTK